MVLKTKCPLSRCLDTSCVCFLSCVPVTSAVTLLCIGEVINQSAFDLRTAELLGVWRTVQENVCIGGKSHCTQMESISAEPTVLSPHSQFPLVFGVQTVWRHPKWREATSNSVVGSLFADFLCSCGYYCLHDASSSADFATLKFP